MFFGHTQTLSTPKKKMKPIINNSNSRSFKKQKQPNQFYLKNGIKWNNVASPEKNVCSIYGPNTKLDENENEKDGYQMLLCTLNVNHQSIENDKCNHCLSLCVNCMYEKMKKKI